MIASKHIKAVMFDLDGTLLNSLEDLANAANRTLAANGHPIHALSDYRYFVGSGAAKLIERALPSGHRTAMEIEKCLGQFLADYDQNWKVHTQPYPGISIMLDQLVDRRVRLAVLSNKPHAFTLRCVTQLLSAWSFDVVLGQRKQVPAKPDPAGALEAAEIMSLPPNAFVYMGDSAIDMQTAAAAGMFPVGVLWGFRPHRELEEGGAKAVIETPAEALRYLT